MRVLLTPVAFGYGTTMRCVAVGNELRRRGHTAIFAASSSLGPLVGDYGFQLVPVPDVNIDEKLPISPVTQLFRQMVEGHLLDRQLAALIEAIDEWHPHVVIYSHSNTAALAASARELPSISIFHPSILRVTSLELLLPMLRKWLKFRELRSRLRPHEEVRLRPRKEVLSAFLGDRSYIPSLPQLIKWPLMLPPALMMHKDWAEPVGALTTEDTERLPPREVLLQELGISAGPFVYVTVGGAIFDVALLERIVAEIKQVGCWALVTGGAAVRQEVAERLSSEKIAVRRFLPKAIRAIKAADVMVWHGGHETMMEAVACGTPAVGVPYQLDQQENVDLLAKTGAGLGVPIERFAPGSLARAIEHVLSDPSFCERARELALISRMLGGVARVSDAAEQLASGQN